MTILGGFPCGSVVKNLPASAGDTVELPGQEDPTCRRATRPLWHSYWVCVPEPGSRNHWCPCSITREAIPKRSLHTATTSSPLSLQVDKKSTQQRRPSTAKNKERQKTIFILKNAQKNVKMEAEGTAPVQEITEVPLTSQKHQESSADGIKLKTNTVRRRAPSPLKARLGSEKQGSGTPYLKGRVQRGEWAME